VVPVVNKADGDRQRAVARDVLAGAFAGTDRFERGLVTSFEDGVCEVVSAPDGP
jgi:hypothetical protein